MDACHFQCHNQGSTEPLKIWGRPTVGTLPAGGLPLLHALNVCRCAENAGGCPLGGSCRLIAGRDKGLSRWGIPGGCQTLVMTSCDVEDLPYELLPRRKWLSKTAIVDTEG